MRISDWSSDVCSFRSEGTAVDADGTLWAGAGDLDRRRHRPRRTRRASDAAPAPGRVCRRRDARLGSADRRLPAAGLPGDGRGGRPGRAGVAGAALIRRLARTRFSIYPSAAHADPLTGARARTKTAPEIGRAHV